MLFYDKIKDIISRKVATDIGGNNSNIYLEYIFKYYIPTILQINIAVEHKQQIVSAWFVSPLTW